MDEERDDVREDAPETADDALETEATPVDDAPETGGDTAEVEEAPETEDAPDAGEDTAEEAPEVEEAPDTAEEAPEVEEAPEGDDADAGAEAAPEGAEAAPEGAEAAPDAGDAGEGAETGDDSPLASGVPFDPRDAHFPVFGNDARDLIDDEFVQAVNDGDELAGEYALSVYEDKWAILPKDMTFDTYDEFEDAVFKTLVALHTSQVLKQLNVNYFEERGLRIGMGVLPDAAHEWHIYKF